MCGGKRRAPKGVPYGPQMVDGERKREIGEAGAIRVGKATSGMGRKENSRDGEETT